MLYPFPIPTWFESGTTSYLILLASLWGVTLALPISVVGFCLYNPRSRTIWIAAEAFWVLASMLLFSFATSLFPFTILRDIPNYLTTAFLWLLLLLPAPAAIAGLMAPVSPSGEPNHFASRLAECSATPLIILLLLFVFPGDGNSATSYRRIGCKHNLKQIGVAFRLYLDQHGKFPDSHLTSNDFPARSWRVNMLPFFDNASLFKSYDLEKPWNSDSNLPVAKHKTLIYVCPSVPVIYRQDPQGRWYTAYATVNGPSAAFPKGKGRTVKEISDGLSNTVLIAEACGQQIIWTEPRDIETSDAKAGINLPSSKPHQSPGIWSSYHKGQAFTLFGDGSVRALNAGTDPQVLRAIITANGGEPAADL